MPRRLFRFALLVVIVAAVNGMSIRLAAVSRFPTPQEVFAYALLFAEVGLTAVWSGLSATSWWTRVAGHSTVVVAAVFVAARVHANHGDWLALFAVQSIAITGPLLLARCMGLLLTRSVDVAGGDPFQFSLRHLFIGMTAFAVLLGLGRVLYPLLRSYSRPAGNIAFEASVLGSGFSVVALIATWTALGTGRRSLKLLVFVVTTFAVGSLVAAITGRPAITDQIAIVSLVVLQAVLLSAALAAFRRAGYRLIRLPDRASPAEPAARLQ